MADTRKNESKDESIITSIARVVVSPVTVEVEPPERSDGWGGSTGGGPGVSTDGGIISRIGGEPIISTHSQPDSKSYRTMSM